MALITSTTNEADPHDTQVPAPLVDQHLFEPERLDADFRVQHVHPGDPLWDPAERFVYRIFRELGFCAESPREWVEETEPWRGDSTLHVVTDGDGRVAGTCRTMFGSYEELPVGQFEPMIPLREGTICEIGSLAVGRSTRGVGVANELHRIAFQHGILHEADGFCFLIDRWMFDFLASHYGLPVRQLAPTRHFMGGEVVPTVMWMPDMLEQIARIRPRVYLWSVEGLPARLWAERDLPVVLE